MPAQPQVRGSGRRRYTPCLLEVLQFSFLQAVKPCARICSNIGRSRCLPYFPLSYLTQHFENK